MNTNYAYYIIVHWVILVVASGALTGCSSGIGEHIATYRHLRAYAKENRENLDLSTERSSHQGVYRASFQPHVDPIPLSRMHAWTLRLHMPEHVHPDSAVILVDGGMPEHGHGLPTRPQVTRRIGDAEYLVEGMKFQMPGWWVVQFKVASAAGTDTVSFNLML